MNRPTFGMLRNSAFARVIKICAGNMAEMAGIANEAQERLLEDPLAPEEGWYGGYVTMTFNVQRDAQAQGYIVAPREVARLDALAVCKQPVFIRNGLFEYLRFGAGLQDQISCCGNACSLTAAYERDSVAIQTDLPAPAQIRVYMTNVDDATHKVVIQGADANGRTVLSIDTMTGHAIEGEHVFMEAPFVTSINTFSTITGFLKAHTKGSVQFMAVESDGTETLICELAPNETTANYRKYFLAGLPNACANGTSGVIQVTGIAKLDLVPVKSDTDYLLIQSIPALIEEAQSIKYSRMDSSEAAALDDKHHQKAIRLLFGQLDHYHGKYNTALSVPTFGSARLTRQPR